MGIENKISHERLKELAGDFIMNGFANVGECTEIARELLSLRAQLEELDKQMPIGWMTDVEVDELHSGVAEEAYIYAHADATSTIPLFKRPAPAISLAELVPDVEENEQAFNAGLNALVDCLEDCGDAEQGLRLALRASRAEILRNIEEAK